MGQDIVNRSIELSSQFKNMKAVWCFPSWATKMTWRKGTAGVDIGSLAELAVEWLASGKQVQLPAFTLKASAGKELSETGDY